MRILSLIHQHDAPAGVFGDVVRELGHELDEASLALDRRPPRDPHEYDAVMVFGGGMNVDEEQKHPWLRDEKALLRDLVERERPVIGVCLGAQLVAEAAGGRVERMDVAEIGWREVDLTPEASGDPLFETLPRTFTGFKWHSYRFDTPPGATELATSASGLQAYRLDGAPVWGIQFHAEATAATLDTWVRTHTRQADARAAHVDPEQLAAQNEREIGRWNEIGRTLCGRFIEAAARRP